MRERNRCDIRNGDHLSALNKTLRPQRGNVASRLRHHPAVHAIVQEAFSPAYSHWLGQKDEADGFHGGPAAGNWGRWNFEGGGPALPPSCTVGEVAFYSTSSFVLNSISSNLGHNKDLSVPLSPILLSGAAFHTFCFVLLPADQWLLISLSHFSVDRSGDVPSRLYGPNSSRRQSSPGGPHTPTTPLL